MKCTSCLRTLPLEQFYTRSDRPTVRPYCILCCRIKKYAKFGANYAGILELYVKQDLCCSICLREFPLEGLQIDHCHKNLRVRSLLCGGCNSGIAFFRESIGSLRSASHYLTLPRFNNPKSSLVWRSGRGESNVFCTSCDLPKTENDFTRNSKQCKKCSKIWGLYKIRGRDLRFLVESQDNSCAICSYTLGSPYIDHDHKCCSGPTSCGACIRGALCNECNKGLGMFKDSIESLKSAIIYLESHSVL